MLAIRRFFLLSVLLFANQASTNEINAQTLTHDNFSAKFFTLNHQNAAFLPIKEVLALPQTHWQAQPSNTLTLTTNRNWLMVEITNNTAQIANAQILVKGGYAVQQQVIFYRVSSTGTKVLPSEWRVNNLNHSQVVLTPNDSAIIYLQINALMDDTVQIDVLNLAEFNQLMTHSLLSTGLAFGLMLAIAVILLCVALANRQRAIFLLAAYYLLQVLILAVMYGFNINKLSSDFQELNGIELTVLMSLSAIVLLWFSGTLFKLTYSEQKLYRLFIAAGGVFVINMFVGILLPFSTRLLLCHLVYMLTLALLFALARHLVKVQDKLANLFMLFVVTQALLFGINIALSGWFTFDATIYTLAVILSGLVIVYLLARQSAGQIDEKYHAQREALESAMQSKKAHDELMALQAKTQEQLENSVQERTLELNIALQELEEANRELEQKNTLDELTGLFNRRYYDQKILAEFRRSRRNLTALSLVVVDIDYFKKINDTYGHSAGDTCLVELAKTIKLIMRRSSDMACRYGGEEFCLILPETDNAGAIAIANELRLKVKEQVFDIQVDKLSLTISCGVSTYQQQADVKPIDIFNAADKALYQAKKNGRDQVVCDQVLSSHTAAQ